MIARILQGVMKMSSQNRELQTQEIKNIIQNQGQANLGGTDFKLNNPTHNDSNLQAIVNAPNFTSRVLGTPTQDGVQTYELNGNGNSIKVNITSRNSGQNN